MTKRRLSPSKIGTFKDLCERRWYFNAVLGIQEPDSGRADSGKGMHWLLKDWFLRREPPSVRHPPPGEGKVGPTEVGMALASLGALPPPGPHLIVEEHLQFEFGGVTYHGYADLTWHTKAGYAIVHDHKSTSSLEWAKDEEQLLFDPQRIIYSYATGVDTLARWQYVETRPVKGEHQRKLVEVFGTRPQIEDAMAWLHENYGQRMIAAYNEPEEARPQNTAACGKFGKEGCPYKHRCQIDGKTRIRNIMSMEAIRERMKARQREMNVAEPAPPPSEPAPPPKVEVVEDPANDTTAAPPEPAAPADPRAPEEQAPRKQRADKGKPRGPRKPKDAPADAAGTVSQTNGIGEPQINVTAEISEELKVLGGINRHADAIYKAEETTWPPAAEGPEQVLLQVITLVRTLSQREQVRVLNAAKAFIVEGL